MTLKELDEDRIALELLSVLEDVRSLEMKRAILDGDEYTATEKMNDIVRITDCVFEIISRY